MLDDLYDTSAPRTPDGSRELAEQLADLAGSAENPTERFVLLQRASEFAAQGGDARRMVQLVARIADEFEVDRLAAQTNGLIEFGKNAGSIQQIEALAGAAARVIDQALAAERFDLADSLSATVERACEAPTGRFFWAAASGRRQKIQALIALQANPNDEEARSIIGRWYCVVDGDWDRALPHFAKGSEPEQELWPIAN